MPKRTSGGQIVFFSLAILIFIGLKLAFRQADTAFCRFLLAPSDFIVTVITGSPSQYIEDTGYYHQAYQFTIDKSCSGYNLMLLSFVLLSFLYSRYHIGKLRPYMILPLLFLIAYMFTIVANASRILISVASEPILALTGLSEKVLHEGTGTVTSLTFLIMLYILTETLLRKRNSYATTA